MAERCAATLPAESFSSPSSSSSLSPPNAARADFFGARQEEDAMDVDEDVGAATEVVGLMSPKRKGPAAVGSGVGGLASNGGPPGRMKSAKNGTPRMMKFFRFAGCWVCANQIGALRMIRGPFCRSASAIEVLHRLGEGADSTTYPARGAIVVINLSLFFTHLLDGSSICDACKRMPSMSRWSRVALQMVSSETDMGGTLVCTREQRHHKHPLTCLRRHLVCVHVRCLCL